jgi:hypothetical protein
MRSTVAQSRKAGGAWRTSSAAEELSTLAQDSPALALPPEGATEETIQHWRIAVLHASDAIAQENRTLSRDSRRNDRKEQALKLHTDLKSGKPGSRRRVEETIAGSHAHSLTIVRSASGELISAPTEVTEEVATQYERDFLTSPPSPLRVSTFFTCSRSLVDSFDIV